MLRSPVVLRTLALIVCLAGLLLAGRAVQAQAPAEPAKKLTIGVMPKVTGIDYFNAVEKGAREAAAELGVELVYDGPVRSDVTRQAAMLETWIARRFDVICIAPEDPDAIAPTLRKARARGIKVLTFDADAQPPSREFFVNQATYESIGRTLVDRLVAAIGPQGKYIILTGSLTAVNQNKWIDAMESYRQQKYPELTNLSPTPKATEIDQALATQVTIDALKTYPDLQGIVAITSVALPGAAEGLLKAGAQDRVVLNGLSSPNSMREYIERGALKEFVLWNPIDLGYLTVQAAVQLKQGTLTKESKTIKAGRLGEKQVEGGQILLGEPMVFNAENVGKFDF